MNMVLELVNQNLCKHISPHTLRNNFSKEYLNHAIEQADEQSVTVAALMCSMGKTTSNAALGIAGLPVLRF